jgi:hypothetical protein
MRHAFLVSLLLPAFAVAQGNGAPQMSQEQMQQMMQQMQGMQTCMQNIDQAALQALQQKGEQLNAEIKALCAAGQRDAAMAKAMAFGKETASDPVMKQMAQCGEGMKDMMPKLPGVTHTPDKNGKPRHICDEQP